MVLGQKHSTELKDPKNTIDGIESS